jgi:hypothetical protein
MSNYDFSFLSSFDFEVLVRDLLQKEHKLTLESFKSGRDQGIDLRYTVDPTKSLIVQCKHYFGSSYRKLAHHLKTEERPKVERLRPQRYLLATSLGLTPQNKEEIKSIFNPHCLSTGDVLGKEDLNNLLGKFPDVERKNFKLWLTSQPVLEKVLHSAVFVQTAFELENIKRKLRYYVQNESYFKAKKILEDQHCCIITGIPGIGKTTLAQILLVDYLARDYELIKVTSDISEAAEVHTPPARRVYYYDDFLGQTSLEQKLGKNEEQNILDFIDAIAKSKTSRLILTTREYILNQARANYQKLARSGVDIFKCVVSLADYTRYDKAKILFNHVYFSGLPLPYTRALLDDRSYLKIIDHKNFNPRIIEWMTDYLKETDISHDNYLPAFIANLNNPTRIWEHAFYNQISNPARHLLLVLGSLPAEILLEDIALAFTDFYKHRSKQFGFATLPGDFKKALKELESNFIQIQKWGDKSVVKFHNPSIRDFLENHLATNQSDVRDLLSGSVFFDQIVALWEQEREEGPSVHRVLKQLPEEIRNSIKRTYLSPDSRLINVHRGSGIVTDKHKNPLSLETRLVYALQIESELSADNSSNISRQMLETVLDRLKKSQGDKHALLLLLSRLKKSELWYEVSQEDFLQQAKEFFMQDIGSLEDFGCFVDFEKDFSDVITGTEREEIIDQFSGFMTREIEWLSRDAKDPDLIKESIPTLQKIAGAFDMNIESDVEEMQECMEALYEKIAEEADYYANQYEDDGESLSRAERMGGDIDALFDSLRITE